MLLQSKGLLGYGSRVQAAGFRGFGLSVLPKPGSVQQQYPEGSMCSSSIYFGLKVVLYRVLQGQSIYYLGTVCNQGPPKKDPTAK